MGEPQLTNAPVDILIIGSGASGGAVAWRLSDAGFSMFGDALRDAIDPKLRER